ncbi:MAG: tyrosine-protein phosphatase [Chloracidobacterium sp.]|nr:tyrosine-protein phosphatase [Chloracidobacterium sp.]
MRKILTVFVALLVSATYVSAQAEPTSPKQFPGIDIENFGQMDTRFFRGSQPTQEDYRDLKEFGINTVIDLRKDSEEYSKPTVESLGMKYINIPMTGWTTRDESVAEFMAAIEDPANGNVYVHCAAGKHRTGLVGAVYRLENYGWDYDTAFKEMKNYKYFSGLFHRKIKSYVKKYYDRFGEEKQAAFRAAQAAKAAAAAGAQASGAAIVN